MIRQEKLSETLEKLDGLIISEGTLRPEDLLDAYILTVEKYEEFDETIEAVKDGLEYLGREWSDEDIEEVHWIIEGLREHIEENTPQGYEFTNSPGDGACIGFFDENVLF